LPAFAENDRTLVTLAAANQPDFQRLPDAFGA